MAPPYILGLDCKLKLLGVPSHYAFAAMIPMGKPVKQLTKLSRKPVSEFAVLERFDGAPLVD